jgi:hypothetical protein
MLSLTLVGSSAASVLGAIAPNTHTPTQSSAAIAQNQRFPSNTLVEQVRRRASRDLDIAFDRLHVLSYTNETWTDGCLGLGGPAELCLQAMVDGWRLEVTDGDQRWTYHTDETGDAIRLAENIPDGSSEGIPPSVRDRLLTEVSRQVNVPVNELRVISSESQVWDGCMGIAPPPNQGCQEIAIWGWRVVVQRLAVMPDDRPTWVFHINGDATDVRLSSYTPPTHSDGIPRRMANAELQDWLDRQDLRSIDPALVQQWVPTESLIVWLEDQWQQGTPTDQVEMNLHAAGWLTNGQDFQQLDVDEDGQDEWLIRVNLDPNPMPWGRSGDFWIIGEELLYRYFEPDDYFRQGTEDEPIPLSQDFVLTAPQLLAVQDYTGDREPELLLQRQICGAHTCTQSYTVLSYRDGAIRSLISQAPSLDTDGKSVVMPYAEVETATDETGDRRPDLLIRGGTYGSAGAGIQRSRTEIWAWDGSAMTLDNIRWEPSEYRFHLLYEANYRLEQGEGDRATNLYRQVIEDESLNDDLWWNTTGSVYDSSRQFAAFRLMVLEMMDDDHRQFRNWERWLRRYYPDAPITEAARRMSDRWDDDDSRDDACRAARDYLVALDDQVSEDNPLAEAPTGPLRYMGYGNPTLSGADVCPLDWVRDSDR